MVEYASLICMMGVRISDFKLQVAVPISICIRTAKRVCSVILLLLKSKSSIRNTYLLAVVVGSNYKRRILVRCAPS